MLLPLPYVYITCIPIQFGCRALYRAWSNVLLTTIGPNEARQPQLRLFGFMVMLLALPCASHGHVLYI